MADLRFVGTKNAQRRGAAESGHDIGFVQPDLRLLVVTFRPYRKRSLTYAVRLDEPFTVETLEGDHTGKAGDYLAIGAHGEMYPIDAAVFADTYDQAGETE